MLKLRGKEALVKDAYLQSLETEAGREKGSAKAHPHGRKTEDFRWLQDRTILLLGDSIDRYHLRALPATLSAYSQDPGCGRLIRL